MTENISPHMINFVIFKIMATAGIILESESKPYLNEICDDIQKLCT